jgi:integrase
MARKTDIIKEKILNEILSMTELENIMAEFEFVPVESEDDTETIKFTNYKSQIWIEGETDTEENILITNMSVVNRVESEPTRVEAFRSYEDLEKVLNWFWDNGHYNHWITAWLMTALGRRVGDTCSLKWSDLYKKDGNYRERLTQLKEEKTGKKVAPILNALAKMKIEEFISVTETIPSDHYTEKIVDTKPSAFRKMLKKAVQEVGLTYDISTHSFRKYWANTIYRLNPQDSDNLMIVQSMLGHSSPEITKIYIGEIEKKQDKYMEKYSDYLISKGNGVDMEISNSPMMVIKAEDFRGILSKCWEMSKNGMNKFDGINELIGIAENLMN